MSGPPVAVRCRRSDCTCSVLMCFYGLLASNVQGRRVAARSTFVHTLHQNNPLVLGCGPADRNSMFFLGPRRTDRPIAQPWRYDDILFSRECHRFRPRAMSPTLRMTNNAPGHPLTPHDSCIALPLAKPRSNAIRSSSEEATPPIPPPFPPPPHSRILLPLQPRLFHTTSSTSTIQSSRILSAVATHHL